MKSDSAQSWDLLKISREVESELLWSSYSTIPVMWLYLFVCTGEMLEVMLLSEVTIAKQSQGMKNNRLGGDEEMPLVWGELVLQSEDDSETNKATTAQ